MYRGGRPGERGIEAQKAPYTAPDRLGPGFEPPLRGVSWVGLAALGGYAVRAVRGSFARAFRGSVGDRTKPPGSGVLLSFLVRAASYRLLARYRIRYGVRTGTAHQGGSETRLEAAFYLA